MKQFQTWKFSSLLKPSKVSLIALQVQKPEDIKEILIRQQHEISEEYKDWFIPTMLSSWKLLFTWKLLLFSIHITLGRKASYSSEVGKPSETTQKLETRSVRLYANNVFGHNVLLITSFFPVFQLLKEVIH